MATVVTRNNTFYGYPNPQGSQFPSPIVAARTPTTADKAQVGQIWVYSTGNNAYLLTSINGGISTWITLSLGGGGIFASLVVNGDSDFYGNITQYAPGVTASFLATTTAGLTNNGAFTNTGAITQNGNSTFQNTGALASLDLQNTDGTQTAGSRLIVKVNDQTGARVGDAQINFQNQGHWQYAMGLDSSDSNKFVIATDPGNLGTNNVFTSTTTGAINLPKQPCFSAVITAESGGVGTPVGVTGNGVNYTIGNTTDPVPTSYTILYESVVGLINANGQFTAPATGRYLFTAGVRMSAYTGVTNAQIQIVSPATIIYGNETCPPAALTAFFSINTSGIIQLNQGDAVSVRINCAGQGANNTVVQGDGVDLLSYFTGALLN